MFSFALGLGFPGAPPIGFWKLWTLRPFFSRTFWRGLKGKSGLKTPAPRVFRPVPGKKNSQNSLGALNRFWLSSGEGCPVFLCPEPEDSQSPPNGFWLSLKIPEGKVPKSSLGAFRCPGGAPCPKGWDVQALGAQDFQNPLGTLGIPRPRKHWGNSGFSTLSPPRRILANKRPSRTVVSQKSLWGGSGENLG